MNEHAHQVKVMEWAAGESAAWPEFELLYAIANAGAGAQRGQAGKMKAEGVKPGVPDLCLPVPRGSYHGLYIEMKTETSGPSPEQRVWLARLKEQGYYTTIAQGYEIAIQILTAYIQWPPTRVVSEDVWEQLPGHFGVSKSIPRCRLAASVLPLKQCRLLEGHEPPCVPDDRPRIPRAS